LADPRDPIVRHGRDGRNEPHDVPLMADLDAQLVGEIRQSLRDIKQDVSEIKEQTTKTNGRVTALETVNSNRAAQDALRQKYLRIAMWVMGVIVAVFSGAIGALILGGGH
jgi:capsule polysaccharide export protein KpsE/RkpR